MLIFIAVCLIHLLPAARIIVVVLQGVLLEGVGLEKLKYALIEIVFFIYEQILQVMVIEIDWRSVVGLTGPFLLDILVLIDCIAEGAGPCQILDHLSVLLLLLPSNGRPVDLGSHHVSQLLVPHNQDYPILFALLSTH